MWLKAFLELPGMSGLWPCVLFGVVHNKLQHRLHILKQCFLRITQTYFLFNAQKSLFFLYLMLVRKENPNLHKFMEN